MWVVGKSWWMSQRYPRERSTDKEIPGYKTVQTPHGTEPYKTFHDNTTVAVPIDKQYFVDGSNAQRDEHCHRHWRGTTHCVEGGLLTVQSWVQILRRRSLIGAGVCSGGRTGHRSRCMGDNIQKQSEHLLSFSGGQPSYTWNWDWIPKIDIFKKE